MLQFKDYFEDLAEAKVKHSAASPTIFLDDVGNVEVFMEYIQENKLLPFVDGKKRVVKNKREVLKMLDKVSELVTPFTLSNSQEAGAKKILNYIRLKTTDGIFEIYDLKVYHLTSTRKDMNSKQALQCIFSACMYNGIPAIPENASKIQKFVSLGPNIIEEVLKAPYASKSDKAWYNSTRETHKVLMRRFGKKVFKGFVFYEETSSFAHSLKKHGGKLSKKAPDKWNAGDIFIVQSGFDKNKLLSIDNISDLNTEMLRLYEEEILISVSLKKTGRGAKYVEKNVDESEIDSTKFNITPEPTAKRIKWKGQDAWAWPAIEGKSKILLGTYAQGKTPGSSNIRMHVRKPGQGQSSGSARNSVMEPFLKVIPKSELRPEFITGYTADKDTSTSDSFWKKFYSMMSIYSNTFSSWKDMRDTAFKEWNYKDGEWYKGSVNITNANRVEHGPLVQWVNVHFLSSYSKLSKGKKEGLLDAVYQDALNKDGQSCAVIEIN